MPHIVRATHGSAYSLNFVFFVFFVNFVANIKGLPASKSPPPRRLGVSS